MPNNLIVNKNDVTLATIANVDDCHTLYSSVGIDIRGSVTEHRWDNEILKSLDAIEKHVAVLYRNRELEDRHPRLKEMADEYYRELEKLKTWERVSK